MNIYVGNLSFRTNEAAIREAFARFGEVSRVTIVTDKFSGEPRGFGFVEMPNDSEAQQAISELNGIDLDGRTLTVNEARPRTEGGGGRSGGGGGRGGFGGGGGRGGDRRGGGGGGRGGSGGGRGGW